MTNHSLASRIVCLVILGSILASSGPATSEDTVVDADAAFALAARHGRQANEQFVRCHRFVAGWLNHADPRTGLIPRNLTRDRDVWNPQDAAADNYPYMVPRINQFPEWFTTAPAQRYRIQRVDDQSAATFTGKQLQQGMAVDLQPGVEVRLVVSPQFD